MLLEPYFIELCGEIFQLSRRKVDFGFSPSIVGHLFVYWVKNFNEFYPPERELCIAVRRSAIVICVIYLVSTSSTLFMLFCIGNSLKIV